MTVRLRSALRRQIEGVARKEGRSFPAQIERLVEAGPKRGRAGPDPRDRRRFRAGSPGAGFRPFRTSKDVRAALSGSLRRRTRRWALRGRHPGPGLSPRRAVKARQGGPSRLRRGGARASRAATSPPSCSSKWPCSANADESGVGLPEVLSSRPSIRATRSCRWTSSNASSSGRSSGSRTPWTGWWRRLHAWRTRNWSLGTWSSIRTSTGSGTEPDDRVRRVPGCAASRDCPSSRPGSTWAWRPWARSSAELFATPFARL